MVSNMYSTSYFSMLKVPSRSFLRTIFLILLVGLLGACNARGAEVISAPTPLAEPNVVVVEEPTEGSQTEAQVASDSKPELALSEVEALVIWTTPAQVEPLAVLGLEFEKTYGIPVQVEAHDLGTMLDDFRQSLSLQSGMPDIFLGGHDWVGLLAANRVVSPLNLENHQAHFAPGVMRAMSYAGQQFGVPVKAESLALVINPQLVSDIPETWTQVREIAAKHVQETGALAGLGINALSPFDFYPVLTGFGGDLFQYAQETGFEVTDVQLGTASSLQALAWLHEMQADGLINLDLSPGDLQQAFIEQQLPLLITGPWSLPALEAAQIEFIVSEFPEGGRPFVNVQGYLVNAYAPDPFLAWLFLSTLVISEEGMAGILAADPAAPAYLPLLGHDFSPHLKKFSQVARRGSEVPSMLEMAEVWRIWGQTHYDVVKNGADGPTSYQDAAEGIKKLIQGN